MEHSNKIAEILPDIVEGCLAGCVPVWTVDPEVIMAMTIARYPHTIQEMNGHKVHVFDVPKEIFLPRRAFHPETKVEEVRPGPSRRPAGRSGRQDHVPAVRRMAAEGGSGTP